MNWEKQQRSNLSDTDPNIGTSLNWQSMGVVMGLAGACCSVSNGLIPNISAAEGQKLASMTITTLLQCRSDVAYDLFWKRIEESGRSLDISEPALPRRRKLPRRLDEGSDGTTFQNPKDYYRKRYFEAIDFIVSSIQDRFDQPGYRMYKNVENLIINTIKRENAEGSFTAVTGDRIKTGLSIYPRL